MRRWLIAILAGHLASAGVGCAWLRSPDVANIIAKSEDAQAKARKAVAFASKAFADALAFVPEANRDAFKARFDAALAIYTESDGVLTSTRTALRAAVQPKVDYATALASIVDAVRGVISIADLVSSAAPSGYPQAADAGVVSADLAAAYRGLHELEGEAKP